MSKSIDSHMEWAEYNPLSVGGVPHNIADLEVIEGPNPAIVWKPGSEKPAASPEVWEEWRKEAQDIMDRNSDLRDCPECGNDGITIQPNDYICESCRNS